MESADYFSRPGLFSTAELCSLRSHIIYDVTTFYVSPTKEPFASPSISGFGKNLKCNPVTNSMA